MNKPVSILRPEPVYPLWTPQNAEASRAFKRLVEASLQDIPPGRMLEIANDRTRTVYVVLSGWLITSKSTEDGHRQIIDFLLPGQAFDPGSATEDQCSSDLSALTNARVARISRRDWSRLLRDYPDLQAFLYRGFAAGYSRMAERLLRLGKGNAESRIAYAICELCLRCTDMGLVDGEVFHLPLNQQVLGDFVGLSSVHVSRTFRRFRCQGILSVAEHMKIVIHDTERLAEIAEIDPDTLRREIISAA